jgi:hypothetical protein
MKATVAMVLRPLASVTPKVGADGCGSVPCGQPLWGDDFMGLDNNSTICQVGCLMSSVSMALRSFNVVIGSNSR